ncbi:MAG: alpha-amylase family glycosyl hydrolase, partial [Cyclobacteriaceae bacterium]
MKKSQHKNYTRPSNRGWLKFLPIWLLLGCDTAPIIYESFDDYPLYSGNDLGLIYSPQRSVFRLWAPNAEAVILRIYNQGSNNEILTQHWMKRKKEGIWELAIKKDLKGKFYTFEAIYNGQPSREMPDPYAKAVGLNGLQAAVIDLTETNPPGWDNDKKPPLENFTDAVIYELHVRDLSIDPNSGIQNKGKFLGLTEKGTKGPNGIKTGLDHIVDLGITHVHLLPVYDFASVDEGRLHEPQFNWGYDPQNYNVPEGSYSTDPFEPTLRIKEFKQMVKTLHDNGLRIVMDVVYNHTFLTENSLFNQLIPDYYYRHNEDGSFSDASACGNEIATERPMVRKMILESVLHWA